MSILRDISQFVSKSGKKDNDDIFAEYIGCEMKQICDSNVKRLLKHRIQNEFFDAQTQKGIYQLHRQGSQPQERQQWGNYTTLYSQQQQIKQHEEDSVTSVASGETMRFIQFDDM